VSIRPPEAWPPASLRALTAGAVCLVAVSLGVPKPLRADTIDPGVPRLDADCVLTLAESADGDMTLAQIRAECAAAPAPAAGDETEAEPSAAAAGPWPAPPQGPGVVERRLAEERVAAERPFSVIAHRPNYFLFAAWNAEGWNANAYRQTSGDPDYSYEDIEGQFQVSLKVPLAVGLFNDRVDIYGAYTNRSFWQMYNHQYSEPFRETNHEPELWAQFANDWQVLGLTNSVNAVGYVHQSNGRSGALSRSWDRLFASFVFEREHWARAVKPWVWISPDKETGDNPDIDRYLGHGELRLIYSRNGHVFSAMTRNQLESGFDRGALELSWSFPVFDYPYLRGYLQYFSGYGESLLDYNNKVNRLGLGISVTDWLD
jgi:phospholipase A1